MRRVRTLAMALAVVPAVAAAQTPSVGYEATVTGAFGPAASSFAVGDRITVAYALDPAVADSDPTPGTGRYSGAVLGIAVTIPGRGIAATAGPAGRLDVFNDVASGGPVRDQFVLFSGPMASATALGGLPITAIEVGLLGPSTMLPSDAIATTRLNSNDAYVFLGTSAGWTQLNFQIVPPPGPPATFQAAVSGNAVTMSWTPPPSGGTVQNYTVLARTQVGGPVVASLPVGLATSFGVTAPNGTFVVSVQAANASGAAESAAVTITVPQATPPPGAPTGLAVLVAGTTGSFSWNPPSTGGLATGYLLVAGTTPGFAVPVASLPLPGTPGLVVPGIPPGTYYVRVHAVNAGGTSGPSNEVTVTVATPTAPGAPTLNQAVVTGNTVTLSWAPGSGDAPTSYVLTAALTPGGTPIVSAPFVGTGAAFGSVPSGTYYVRVTALNSAGGSPPSNEITVVVP